MKTAVWGKLKGKGCRYATCPSCGRVVDITRDHIWFGDGGWYCDPCGSARRNPAKVNLNTVREAHAK